MLDKLLICGVLAFITIKNLIFLNKNNYFKFTEKLSVFIIIIYVLSFAGGFMNYFYSENWEDFFRFAASGQEIAQLFGYSLLIILACVLTYNDTKKIQTKNTKNAKHMEN